MPCTTHFLSSELVWSFFFILNINVFEVGNVFRCDERTKTQYVSSFPWYQLCTFSFSHHLIINQAETKNRKLNKLVIRIKKSGYLSVTPYWYTQIDYIMRLKRIKNNCHWTRFSFVIHGTAHVHHLRELIMNINSARIDNINWEIFYSPCWLLLSDWHFFSLVLRLMYFLLAQ